MDNSHVRIINVWFRQGEQKSITSNCEVGLANVKQYGSVRILYKVTTFEPKIGAKVVLYPLSTLAMVWSF